MAAWLDDLLSQPDPRRLEPATVAHLAHAVRAWLLGGMPELPAALGLPRNAEAARQAVRDQWLREAARELGVGMGPWERARQLDQAVRQFRGRRWPCWCDRTAPPTHATRLDACLFRAMRAAGGRMPDTARRFDQILRAAETKPAWDFSDPLA